MNKIILASSSPRRKELLQLIHLPFTVHPSDVDENISEPLPPNKMVEELAYRKAADIAKNYHEGIVIGADTIVVLDDEILGKPKNVDDAFAMLTRLQGRTHEVYSGIAIIDAATEKNKVTHQKTKVVMKPLTEEEITLYINTKEPMDKAGSYGIQGIGAMLIEGIEGDYFNVVGLPVSLLTQELQHFGIHIMKQYVHPKSDA